MQFSVRLSDEQAAAVRRLAAARGRSVNQTFEDLVVAATDPAHAGDAVLALRERLARAGLTFDVEQMSATPAPGAAALRRARAAAGRGTSLSDIVSEGRR
jgi:hypothetical protein